MIRIRDDETLAVYVLAMIFSNALMMSAPWGSAYLSLIILMTYLRFMPTSLLHPNNMVFGFYALYVVLSSTLNLILNQIGWEYVLPWGQSVYWEDMSLYVLLQIEFTFLVLFFGLHFFCSKRQPLPLRTGCLRINSFLLHSLYFLSLGLVFLFIQSTAGLDAWITDYSLTYLTRREGHGLLNVIIIALGTAVVFLLGVEAVRAHRKWPVVVRALVIMSALAFIGGVKARFIFLLIVFCSPAFVSLTLSVKKILFIAFLFFTLLYLGTLVRTEGFYASPPFFLEMLIGYFNSYQLHDYIVTSRGPDLFQTIWQVFIKPLQILGLASADADFDISVMLTKEFFPEQWNDEHATQQWPLETELYLNYYGFILSWLPLLCYAAVLAFLYRKAILQQNLFLMPVFMMEFQRIFSTLRGTLIPWETPIYLGQYLLIYFVCKLVLGNTGRALSASRSGDGAAHA